MRDDSIDVVILHIDVGYLVTLPELRMYTSTYPTGNRAPAPTAAPPGRGLRSGNVQLDLSRV
jgi:hypothetical protein